MASGVNMTQFCQLLTIDHKENKLQWSGTEQELKCCIDAFLEVPNDAQDDEGDNAPKWSEDPTHNLITYKARRCVIKFYISTKTLLIQGPQHESLKDKLKQMKAHVSSQDGGNNNEEENHSRVILPPINSTSASSAEPPAPKEPNPTLDRLLNEFQQLRSEVEAIKQGISNPNPTTNDREQYLLCEITVLKRLVDKLEGKKASLVTALHLLMEDKKTTSPTVKKPLDERPRPILSTDSSSKNKRHDMDTPSADPDSHWHTQRKKKSNAKHDKQTRKIIIAGDSIVKNIQGHKMAKHHRVTAKSFTGATVADMADYVKPILREKPNEIIVHVGTNDLKDHDPRQVANEILNLANTIVGECMKVSISSLTCRNDFVNAKVGKVNKLLLSICHENEWSYIAHTNITSEDLLRGGLHLSGQGTKELAANFIKHIRNN